jgi:protein-S-isoprenylcysteine O-methyltransferase Ste14
MKNLKVLPPTYLLISILAMVALHFLFLAATLIPLPWNLLGLIPLALGLAVNFSADKAFQRAKTSVKPFEESTVLITDGIFRLSRNPMYLGFAFVLAGVAFILGSLTPWLIIPLFVSMMDLVFIRVEERMLAAKFGQAWLEYKARVRRWL